MVLGISEWFLRDIDEPGQDIGGFRAEIPVHPGEEVSLRLASETDWPNVTDGALLAVQALNRAGEPIPISDGPRVSKVIGAFQYVSPGPIGSPATTEVSLTVPRAGRKLVLTGVPWMESVSTHVVGRMSVHRADRRWASWRDTIGSWTAVPEGTVDMRVTGRFHGLSAKAHRVALEFVNKDSGRLLPAWGQAIDPRRGPCAVFRPVAGEREGTFTTEFKVPERATHVRWHFDNPVWTELDPILEFTVHEKDTLQDFLADVDEGQPLILIDSTAPPLGSGKITIRPNNLANMFSSMGLAVVFVGFGRRQGNRRRQAHSIFQASREEIDMVVAEIALEAKRRRCIYMCTSFASTSAVGRTDYLKMYGWDVLYEIRDNMEEFNRVGLSQWYSAVAEVLQCRKSDWVSTVSPALARKVAAIAPGQTAVVSPNAIMERFITGSVHMRELESVEARRRQGRVGYVGHLTDAWFDWHRFLKACAALPDTTFELVGPGLPPYISLPPNVTSLGSVDQESLAALAQRWCVGIIPFVDSPLTLGVDPNKLYEYTAWGLRTVSARMGSIDECPTAVSYDSDDSFIAAIQAALSEPRTQDELDQAAEWLNHCTWLDRAKQTLSLMGVQHD